MIEAYFIHLAILVGIYLILAISLQLTIGYSGLLNIGHIAFFGIGAYTSALMVMNGVPFLIAFLSAGIVTMLFGFLLSLPLNKLKGDYLALATLGFSFVIYAILLNWVSLTRGPLGIPGITKPNFFGFVIANNFSFLIFTAIIAAITYFVIRQIVNSPFGKVLESIRDDELASKTLGKNTFKMKMYAMGISAFFAGIAGSLYAHYITFIDPSSFTLLQIIPIVAIVIIGGLASLKGTFIATFILVLLPEPLRFIGFPSSIVGPMRQIIYALLLLLILIYRPKGLFGRVELD
ncbi:branched-chain amino acid ABC transporter permease [Candidatus Woesearchaeota archaeon]|jgi:branched-chain amino acid transport system permease protein|nr:branched-chain amino acid ABC transporter permease [Candidatus Woesearchaeota archaeon]MBT4367991.1 branched-chain amino acid ABC transporter permease [Candidatus Woesearchaeota archaeon]MBT4712479.1 branched-chain amino acid ABC transporter permease [Candidatus Woesearchaeota archaeon]MBT6639392.1 branched-chain amino acid ABC transporter permease [Candidatus Woesearchaeota archaeon]MBT7133564.1 branched-chain amino acid ABC transporter permease [Candidatus Woesearchaeota archaeon]